MALQARRSRAVGALCAVSRPEQAGSVAAGEDQYAPMMTELMEFLKEDLLHLFDDQGVDASRYDSAVEFTDPITKYNDINGYLFNIQMLRRVFSPKFVLHSVKRSGPLEITTRWTMEMELTLSPLRPLWSPTLVFTGVSIMGVNPVTGKFRSHEDKWDSIQNNSYFSLEALADLVRQVTQLDKSPDLETPEFAILKRMATYEVRDYGDFLVAETDMGASAGPANGGGFNQLAGYIFGGNNAGERMEMTTPVFTRMRAEGEAGPSRSMQFVIEKKYGADPSMLPAAADGSVQVRREQRRIVAAIKFPGIATNEDTVSAERELRAALLRDGLRPRAGYSLARYNDPSTPGFLRRNEVLIELDGFVLE